MKNEIFVCYFVESHLQIAVLLTCREVLVEQLAIIRRVLVPLLSFSLCVSFDIIVDLGTVESAI
jgi:hypothetical protein